MEQTLKRLWKKTRPFLIGLAVALLFPYVMTLAWSGNIHGMEEGSYARESKDGHGAAYESGQSGIGGSQRRIYLGNGQNGYIDAEEYLISMVARQIPAEYDAEAIKAQVIIARTYLYRQMNGKSDISADELDMGYLEEDRLEKLWGESRFVEYYEKISRAVEETKGIVITYQDQLIEPLFHRASAGTTRNGDLAHPYLVSVDSSFDVEADGYLTIEEWSPEELIRLIGDSNGGENQISSDHLMDSIQLVSRDNAGYVSEIQIGTHIYTGDEVRALLGLKSAAFVIKEHEGNIQVVSSGIGHGLGLSQHGADHLAKEGWRAEDILKYYYQDVEIILSDS